MVLGSAVGACGEFVERIDVHDILLAGLSLIVVETDNIANSMIEARLDFMAEHVIGDSGFS